MKLEKEPEFFQSSDTYKNDSKSFEYNSISYDPIEPESTMKENRKEMFISKQNGHGRNADQLASRMKDDDGYWNTPELEFSLIVDNSTNSNGKGAKNSVVAVKVPDELSQDSDVYSGKIIIESYQPEMIVCYKESTWPAPKDICVDEGLPSEDKLLAKDLMDDHSSLPSNGYDHTDTITEASNTDFLFRNGLRSSYKDCKDNAACGSVNEVDVDKELLVQDGQISTSKDDIDHNNAYTSGTDRAKFSSESGKDKDDASFCDSGDLIQQSQVNRKAKERITDDATTSELVSGSTLLVNKFHGETTLKFLLESARCGDNDVSQLHNEAILQVLEVPKTKESNVTDNLVCNKAESISITSSFDSSYTGDESHENVTAQPLNTQNEHIHDVGVSDNLIVNSLVKPGEVGESSFSIADPVSDAVPHSGSIPFSGSISLRSDSSTTSTRSFAFPVLKNEWNSSPIRMAKADQRRFRNRGCIAGLLCCRF